MGRFRINALTITKFYISIIILASTIPVSMEIQVSTISNRVNRSSKNIFRISVNSSLTSDYKISITVPYQIFVNTANLVCELATNKSEINVSPKTCELENLNGIRKINVVITTNFDLINTILDITILTGIVNPQSTYVEKGEINIYDNKNKLIPAFTETISFSYVPNTMTCTLTSSSENAGERANYTFSLLTSSPILRAGSILINFPYFNQDSGAPTLSMLSLINGTPSLTDISGIDSSSKLFVDPDNVKRFIKLVNIFPNNESDPNNRITFTITNVVNPPSTDALGGFRITTLDNLDYSIDQTEISLKVKNPMQINNLIINFRNNVVNNNSLVNFTFNHICFLPTNIRIRITFPSDYPISYSSNFSWISGVDNLVSDITYNVSGNVLTLTNPTNIYYGDNNYHTFSLFELTNPTSTKPTGNFTFEILTSSGNLMYVFDGNLNYTASPGNFPSINISLPTTSVNSITDYSLTFTPQSRLLPNSYIKITFPTEIISQEKSGSFSCSLVSAISEILIASCEYTLESNRQILFIRNAFKNGFNGNIALSMKLSKIVNHSCAATSGSFIIESFSDENYAIDQRNRGITVTFTEGALINPKITPTSNIIWDINKYEFSFSITNSLQDTSIIEIIFPRDIIVNKSEDSLNYPCEMAIDNIIKADFDCQLNSQVFKITNFCDDGAKLPPNTNFLLKIPDVQNRRNLQESESFTINTYLSPGCKLDKNFQELKVKSTISLKIKSITVTPESNLNGDTTSYEISITPGGKIISGDQIKFSIPKQLTSSSGASSILVLGNGAQIKTQICNEELNYFKIKIESEVVDGNIKFKILAMKNNYSLKPYDNFGFSILDSTGDSLESFDNEANPIILAQASNHLSNPKIESPDSSTIIFSFRTFNRIPINGVIRIKINPKLDTSGGLFACEDLSAVDKKEGLSCLYSGEDSVITIDNKFAEKAAIEGNSIKISLNNLKFILSSAENANNNNNNQNSYITIDIETFEKIESLNESTNQLETLFYSIDKAVGIELAMGCNTFCAKCLTNGTTCTQCISSQYILKDGVCRADCPDSNPLLFEDLSNLNNYNNTDTNTNNNNKICLKTCPDGYFADLTEKKCIKCIAPCTECFSKTSCKNCLEGFVFYPAERSCSLRCPAGSTKTALPENKGFLCVDCHENCLSCESSDYAKCISCISTKILFNSSCIEPGDCPKGTVAFEGKCAFCDPKCEVCTQQPSKCLKCAAGHLLDEVNFTCFKPVEQCAVGYFVDNDRKCSLCDKSNFQCLECDGEFACKKCKPGFSLEVSKCVRTCSEGFYFDASRLECKRCSASCRTCALEEHKCTSCYEFSFLHEFKCDFACPDGYFKDGKNRVCKRCENTCKSCSDELAAVNASESSLLPTNSNTNCVQCVNGLYLLSGICIFKCPSSYISDDPTRRCISSRLFNTQKKNILLEYKNKTKPLNQIYSFYFAYVTFGILLLFYFYKLCDQKLFYFGACSGLISFIDLAIHIYICYLYFKDSFTLYFIILGGALCFRIILNNIFILAYNIHTQKDTGHRYWTSYNRIKHYIANMLILIDFKAIRLTYSRFLKGFSKSEFFDHKFSKYSRIHKLYRLFRLFDMLIVDFAVFLSGSLFLYFNVKFNFVWFLTSEFIVIRVIILAFALIDLMVNKKIDQDFFYQTKSRIDVVPNLKHFVSPYKEKYNLRFGGNDVINSNNETNSSHNYNRNKNYYSGYTHNNSYINRNTDCNTIRRSNSDGDLFSALLERNKALPLKLKIINQEDFNDFIPRDDSYLIQSSDNPQRYYSKLLQRDDVCLNSKIKLFAKANKNIKELEYVERKNSLAIKNHKKLSLNSSIKELCSENIDKIHNPGFNHYNFGAREELNTCPNFNFKTGGNFITEKTEKEIGYPNEYCSNFINQGNSNNPNNDPNHIYCKDKKVFYTEQSNFGDGFLNFNKSFNSKNQRGYDKKSGSRENKKQSQFYFDDKSNGNDDIPKIEVYHLNRNSFIFNKPKSDLIVNKSYLNDEASFMNYSDRSSNCLQEK